MGQNPRRYHIAETKWAALDHAVEFRGKNAPEPYAEVTRCGREIVNIKVKTFQYNPAGTTWQPEKACLRCVRSIHKQERLDAAGKTSKA